MNLSHDDKNFSNPDYLPHHGAGPVDADVQKCKGCGEPTPWLERIVGNCDDTGYCRECRTPCEQCSEWLLGMPETLDATGGRIHLYHVTYREVEAIMSFGIVGGAR